ncbi:MAG: SPOR domain-containing protein [Calditrichaeota bacterium]|nr:MAG: SPOR domain-containing protein [Calditrichota bacterium]
MRWFSLRLFASLIFLPFFAALTLFILHGLVMQNVYFQDVPVVLLLWLIIFVISHFLLNSIGQKRFQYLLDSGWQALKTNQTQLINEIFLQIDSLLNGGLLTKRLRTSMREAMFRRFFDFYQKNVQKKNFRHGLLECMKLGIHTEEAYHALKTWLLQQPVLTMPIVDLAEALLERKPHDKNVAAFMVGKYLADRQKHFRAEYFYASELEQNDRYSEDIFKLCFPGIKYSNRKDAFACQIYMHSLRESPQFFEQFGPILYKTHKSWQMTGRDDSLAKELATTVATFDPGLLETWDEHESTVEYNTLSARLSRLSYHIQQQFIFIWGKVLLRKKEVIAGLSICAFLVLVVVFVPFSDLFKSAPEEPEQPPAQVAPVNTRFSVQVSASKKRSGALTELNRLKAKQIDAFMIEPDRKGGWYKIYVGKFATMDEARQKGAALKQEKAIRDFFVVNYKGNNGQAK